MDSGCVETTLVILGMRGNDCRERIVAALMRIRGVHDVEVSLFRLTAVVRHEPSCTRQQLSRAVERAGCAVEDSLFPPSPGRTPRGG